MVLEKCNTIWITVFKREKQAHWDFLYSFFIVNRCAVSSLKFKMASFEDSLKTRLTMGSADPPDTDLDYYSRPENYTGSNLHTCTCIAPAYRTDTAHIYSRYMYISTK